MDSDDKKITQLTRVTSISDSDLFVVVVDVGTAPTTKAIEKYLIQRETQYKITPTVVSNDLVLTITHADGTTPSTTRPLWFLIGNTWRACTAELAVTKAYGTNWAALGSAELGTKEQDLFAYVVWNTNLTPDAVDVLWSRRPDCNLYSDFSATTTNQSYGAINATAPAATNEVALIGRFAATLSLTGTSHVWTVPTYTNTNLIHKPIYETRILSTTCAVTAQAGTPTTTTVNSCTLQIIGRRIKLLVDVTIVAKGTATQSIIMTTGWNGTGIGYASEIAYTGNVLSCTYGALLANAISMRKYDATTPWVDSWRVVGIVDVPL